jgi:hypothetical protein
MIRPPGAGKTMRARRPVRSAHHAGARAALARNAVDAITPHHPSELINYPRLDRQMSANHARSLRNTAPKKRTGTGPETDPG